jgi:hypothetical protein
MPIAPKKVAVGAHTRGQTQPLSEAASMDIFKNPDEVIQEVEQEESRREYKTDLEDELDESPEDQQPDKDLDDGED